MCFIASAANCASSVKTFRSWSLRSCRSKIAPHVVLFDRLGELLLGVVPGCSTDALVRGEVGWELDEQHERVCVADVDAEAAVEGLDELRQPDDFPALFCPARRMTLPSGPNKHRSLPKLR